MQDFILHFETRSFLAKDIAILKWRTPLCNGFDYLKVKFILAEELLIYIYTINDDIVC